LKYIDGNLFVNGFISSLSEIAAFFTSGFLLANIGLKQTLLLSFGCAMTGMVALIIYSPEDHLVNQFLISLFVLGSKFGISQAMNLAYQGNVLLFPVSIVGSVFGVCNIFARSFTIFAPFVAELQPIEISQWMFVAACLAALGSSVNIK
jgi:hypothetical protein